MFMQWLSYAYIPGVYTEYTSECIDKPKGGDTEYMSE